MTTKLTDIVRAVRDTANSAIQPDDSRLTDSRTPTNHSASHATGGSDAITPVSIGAAETVHTHSIEELPPILGKIGENQEGLPTWEGQDWMGSGGAAVSLVGPTSSAQYKTEQWTISNYSSFSVYTASVSSGDVSVTGNIVEVTFASNTPSEVILTVTRDGVDTDFMITVQPVIIAAPSVTVDGLPDNVTISPVISTSPFSISGAEDTHLSTSYRIKEKVSGTVAWEALNSPHLTMINTSDSMPPYLSISTEYVLEVWHTGTSFGDGEVTVVEFTTAGTHIITPTLTVEGSPSQVPETPLLTASEFSVGEGSDNYVHTDWRVKQGEVIVWESLADSVNQNSIEVPEGVLAHNIEYSFMVRYHGEMLGDGEWRIISATTNISVGTPSLTVSGTPSNVPETPTLTTSEFIAYGTDDTHLSTDYRVEKEGSLVWESLNNTSDKLSKTVPAGVLTSGESYTFKARHTGAKLGHGLWVEVEGVTLFYIENPTLSVEGFPSEVPNNPTLIASAYITVGSSDSHLNSDWRALDSGNNVVWSSLADSVNKTSIVVAPDILENEVEYTFQVRFRGNTIGETEWVSIAASPSFYIGVPSLTVEGSPNEVPEQPVLTTSAFNPVRVSDTHELSDWKIEQDGVVVWESLEDTEHKTTISVPEGVLAELTTYQFMVRHKGVKTGYGDWQTITATTVENFVVFDDGSSIDGLTYASMVDGGRYDSVTDTGYFGEVSSSTLITGDGLCEQIRLVAGTSINSTGGWLKFYVGPNAECNAAVRRGESPKPYVVYIAKKPIRHTVSWDHINEVKCVFGKRTAPIQNKLFRVRLMTGASSNPIDVAEALCEQNKGGGSEWNELMYRVHQDVPTCSGQTWDGGPQVGANWASFTNADIVVGSGNGRVTWTQETNSASTTNRVFRGSGRLSNLYHNASSGTNVAFGFRPALELVQLGDEPFRAIDSGPGPQELNYDPTTDTGYYGECSAADLITGDALCSAIGLTAGTSQHSDAGWLKFYSHGEVLFIAKKPIRHTVSWDHINEVKCVFGKRTAPIQNKLFRVRLMTGASSNPIDVTEALCEQNKGGGSEWNELMYRVHQNVPTCPSTTWDGGPQVGANWASFTDADIVVASGDGQRTWTQETNSADTSRRVTRGHFRLSYLRHYSSFDAVAHYGFRPALELVQLGDEPFRAIDSGPGPQELNYDPTTDTGYYGECSAADLITGDALCSAIGLTAGTSQHSDAGWLKFYSHGEVLFIAKKPIRHSVSWDHIHARDCVFGRAQTIGSRSFKVRLMTGASSNPIDVTEALCEQNKGGGSEWNELMYRVHQDVPTCSGQTWDGGPQVGANWASFTDADIVVGSGDGRATWTQETNSADTTRRVNRGHVRLSHLNRNTSSNALANYGFRPALEL